MLIGTLGNDWSDDVNKLYGPAAQAGAITNFTASSTAIANVAAGHGSANANDDNGVPRSSYVNTTTSCPCGPYIDATGATNGCMSCTGPTCPCGIYTGPGGGCSACDQAGNQTTNPAPPPGYTYDPTTGALVPINQPISPIIWLALGILAFVAYKVITGSQTASQ